MSKGISCRTLHAACYLAQSHRRRQCGLAHTARRRRAALPALSRGRPCVPLTSPVGQVLESTRSPSDGGEEDADRAELEDKLRRSVDVGR